MCTIQFSQFSVLCTVHQWISGMKFFADVQVGLIGWIIPTERWVHRRFWSLEALYRLLKEAIDCKERGRKGSGRIDWTNLGGNGAEGASNVGWNWTSLEAIPARGYRQGRRRGRVVGSSEEAQIGCQVACLPHSHSRNSGCFFSIQFNLNSTDTPVPVNFEGTLMSQLVLRSSSADRLQSILETLCIFPCRIG